MAATIGHVSQASRAQVAGCRPEFGAGFAWGTFSEVLAKSFNQS